MKKKNMKRSKTHKGKWTKSDEQKLIHLRRDGVSNIEIAAQLKRTSASVSMRCTKLRRRGVDIAKRHSGTGPPFGNEFRKGTGNNDDKMLQRAAFPSNWTKKKSPYEMMTDDRPYFPREPKEEYNTLAKLGVCKDELSKARIKILALEEYSAQLERENKALIKALRVTNSLVDVYTKRDED